MTAVMMALIRTVPERSPNDQTTSPLGNGPGGTLGESVVMLSGPPWLPSRS